MSRNDRLLTVCPVYRSSVACEAAATAQLATYAFPQQAPPVFHWFESCVEEIVKNLDKAPFLQLVFPDRKASFERHQVNAIVIAVPQVRFVRHLHRFVRHRYSGQKLLQICTELSMLNSIAQMSAGNVESCPVAV